MQEGCKLVNPSSPVRKAENYGEDSGKIVRNREMIGLKFTSRFRLSRRTRSLIQKHQNPPRPQHPDLCRRDVLVFGLVSPR
jgi:hypothetical protein